jgi:hypothetical protein
MGLIIKLGLAALVANAAWQTAAIYAAHVEFRDEVRQAAQYRGTQNDEELSELIVALAEARQIPMSRWTFDIASASSTNAPARFTS